MDLIVNSDKPCKVRQLVVFLVEFGATNFWKIESKVWKSLYKQQRGGKAFDSIQEELASARAEISRLKKNNTEPHAEEV